MNFLRYFSCFCGGSANADYLLSPENQEIHDTIKDIEYSNTVPFMPPIHYGKVIKVYDGDTITIASLLPNTVSPIYRFSVRLNGIDTPEIKSKTKGEHEMAIRARDLLNDKIYGEMVELKNVGNEKYGRILADVYLQNENINQWLINEHVAIPYDGGKKQTWSNNWGSIEN